MAIGDPISTSVPSVGASGPGYATDINALLQEYKNRLTVKVPYSSLVAGAAPGSNRSALTVNSAGSIDPNSASNTISNDIFLGTGNVVRHSGYTRNLPVELHALIAGTAANQAAGGVITSGGGATFVVSLPALLTGERLLSVNVRGVKTTGGTASFKIRRITTAGATDISSTSNTTTSGVYTVLGIAPSATEDVADGESFQLHCLLPAAGDSVTNVELVYSRP